MSLYAKFQKSPFVFTGNPIILNSLGPQTDMLKGGKFTVAYQRDPIYEGRFCAPLNLDISEIASAATRYLAEPKGDGRNAVELIERIELGDGGVARRISVTVDYDGQYVENYEMIGIPGGIPRQQFLTYASAFTDVFESRFCGPGCNFFFTSRTHEWRIEMKETEIYPLYFIATGQNYRFRIPTGESIDFDLEYAFYCLDPAALRKAFMDRYGILPSVFDVETEDGGYCCQIVITHCDPAKERYRLKFRNSLGVFEIMEIRGKLTESRDFPGSEEQSYKRFDMETRRYSNLRERLESNRILEITTPVPMSHRIMLADMLSSDEIFLLDAYKTPVRVNVSSENLTLPKRREEPDTVTLRMEMTAPDHFVGEEISGTDDGRKPRIHSDEFTKEFN